MPGWLTESTSLKRHFVAVGAAKVPSEAIVSTVEPASLSATVFEILDKVNPQCYSASGQYGGGSSISWLRKPDDVEFQRLWYRHHRVWWGSPVGNWDPDFYSGGDRPLAPGNNAGSAYRVFN